MTSTGTNLLGSQQQDHNVIFLTTSAMLIQICQVAIRTFLSTFWNL